MIINNTPIQASAGQVVEELRSQLHANGIQLMKYVRDTPDNIMVSCPFHKGGQERKPSAGIKKSDGTFHCFACGETHTLPEVISYCFGKDDMLGIFGWNWVLKNFVTVSIESRGSLDLNLDRSKKSSANCTYVPETELDKYREYHPYMWKRKMTPKEVERFDIGYDKETNSITFPVRDISGNTLFVARRSVSSKFFNYPAGAEKPVYGLYEISQISPFPKEVIICESMIDAITCWVYGKPAVALNGLGNELQMKQLRDMPCRKFILATDNDSAGQQARLRLRKYLKSKMLTEYVFPEGRKDINDLSKEEFLALKETM